MFSASLIIFMILASNMAEDTSSSHTKIAVLWFLEFAGILTRRKKKATALERRRAPPMVLRAEYASKPLLVLTSKPFLNGRKSGNTTTPVMAEHRLTCASRARSREK
jgi:hypothetical protein